MKKLFTFIIAAIVVSMATAQPPMGRPGMRPGMGMGMGHNREQGPQKSPVERIAGLTEELQLSAEQAEKFAPVYLAYQGEIRKIRQDLKKFMDSYEGQEIDEKAAFRMVMAQLDADADIIACKKEYMRVFKNHLTPEQMSKIFLVEKMANRPHRPAGAPQGPPQNGPQGRQ